MKKIQILVDKIEDELEGAKDYAETYLDMKSRAQSTWANKYKSMAEQELSHAITIHERAVEEIAVLNKVYTPPIEMEEKWKTAHKSYVEKAAWVRQMLAM